MFAIGAASVAGESAAATAGDLRGGLRVAGAEGAFRRRLWVHVSQLCGDQSPVGEVGGFDPQLDGCEQRLDPLGGNFGLSFEHTSSRSSVLSGM